MGRVLVEEQSTVAICSEMDSEEWVHCSTVEWVYCSGPESGIQLLADTINHCCPGWSSAHTATTTTTSPDTTMMMNRRRSEEDEIDAETGQRCIWSIGESNGDWPSEKLDKVRGALVD